MILIQTYYLDLFLSGDNILNMKKKNENYPKNYMKFSTEISRLQSPRQGRNSQPLQRSDSKNNDSLKKIYPCQPNTHKNNNELYSSQNQFLKLPTEPKGIEKPFNIENVQKMIKQLKQEYCSQVRQLQSNTLTKSKSFNQKDVLQIGAEKPLKRSFFQLQQKISEYNSKCKFIEVKSVPKLLQIHKSPDKSNRLNEKTEKCRQICQQIKRKLFKETVSTTTTNKSTKKGLCISDFHLQKLIGQGKFSKVYIARHKYSGFVLAVKIIKKQTIKRQNFIEQLIRQIKIQSYFNHINLVKFYSFFQDRINFYLLMQYCVGGQLYNIFKVKSKLRQDQWQPILKGVCEGLYQLHKNSVIHRDLKPQNIMMSFGIPKIGDFGWSVYNPQDKCQTFCGTPLYISPEQLLGNRYDNQVDIWALGVMMYQFLTGRIPFNIQHESNLLQIVHSNVIYPSTLSKYSIQLLKMILEKDPHSRIGILDILDHPFLFNSKTNPNVLAFRFSR